MASEKQLRANRANAKRSTGPKTLRKTLSCKNACKHGLPQSIVIGDEDPNGLRPRSAPDSKLITTPDRRLKGNSRAHGSYHVADRVAGFRSR